MRLILSRPGSSFAGVSAVVSREVSGLRGLGVAAVLLASFPGSLAEELPANLSRASSERSDKYIYLPARQVDDDLQPARERSKPVAARRGELLVRLRSHSSLWARQGTFAPAGATVKRFRPLRTPSLNAAAKMAAKISVLDHLALVTVDPRADLGRVMEEIRSHPDVVYAEPNYRLQIAQATEPLIPDDFDFAQLWGLHNLGQADGVQGADIGTLAAWEFGTGHKGVVVAVLDTGVDYYHPDLAANVWLNSGEIAGNGIDDDDNGQIDDVHGYDFVSDDSDPMDDHGHGTHVAGTIGAVGNNRIGITGVCWEVGLMAVKSFDETGNGEISTAIEGIRYAIENGAQIINASWGNNERSRALEEVIREAHEAGVTFVAAAGNDNSESLFFPAAYDHVIGVAATDARDRRSRFSDFGAYVDLAAPGENIFSTLPNNAYGFFSGTSMATPHVAGVAALVLSRRPEFTNDQLENILRNAVDLITPDKAIGTGRLNAFAAVRVNAPLPEVALRLPETIYGEIDISGTATGQEFVSYSLEYGRGTHPTNWTSFYSSATPVPSGTLFQRFSTPVLGEGQYTFRLTAENAAGERAIERASVHISNVHISAPNHNDILRAGARIPIEGTVFGESRTFRIEVGEGPDPAAWSDAGIELASGGVTAVRDGVLAVWDTAAALPNRFYTLKLTATAGDKTTAEFITRLVYLDSHLKEGWPRHVPIIGNYPAEDWRDLAVADLDNDGFDEIILVDHGNSDGRAARLLVYRHDGTLSWSQELASGYPYSDIPVAGDANGDGLMEVFVDVGDGGQLFAFRHDGQPMAGKWPVRLDVGGLGKVLADLDGDGDKEIVGYSRETVTKGNIEFRQLVVLDHEGNLLRVWEVPACDAELDAVELLPAVGNLDGDPDLEIVAVSGCDTVAVFKLSNSFGPLWTAATHGTFVAPPAVGDLDRDGTNEIVIAAFDLSGGKRGGVHAFDRYGKPLPGWPVLIEESFSAAPALGDVDGDGQLEISLPSWKSGLLHLLRRDGFEVPGWPVGPVKKSSVKSSAILGDIDGDGRPDVVLSSPGYMSVVQSTGDLSQAGGVKAWSGSGHPISLTGSSQPVALVMESSGGVWLKAAPPILADIDHNGKLDVIAASVQDRTYLPPGEKSERKSRSSIYVWELNTQYDPEQMPWPAFQGGADRAGYSPAPPRINQPPSISTIPDQIVAPGSSFFRIELDQYFEDPDNLPRQIEWAVEGNKELVVTITTNRIVTIRAPSGVWVGKEALRFVARDPGGLESAVTASFEVRAGYVAPVAASDHVQTLEDSPVEIDVLANDTDLDPSALRISGLTRPSLGQVTLSPSGAVQYVPAPDANGTDSFSYILVNGEGGMSMGAVAVEIIPVQDPPIAGPDNVVIDEDTPVELDLIANDTDADGDNLRIIDFTAPKNGTFAAAIGGAWRYSPKNDFYGSDSFTYVVTDDHGGTNHGTVSVIVKPVNDLPVAESQEFTLNKNASQNIVFHAADPDDTEFTFNVVQSPKQGTLWNYPEVATYYPTNGFVGTDSFTYRANDGKDDGPVATMQFTVLDANNPPEVQDDSIVTKVDQPAEVNLSATDLDSDPVTFQIVSQPERGTLSGGGTNYVYEPPPGFLGQDRFTFQASDGIGLSRIATVNIKVTDQNTAPVADDFSVRTLVNTPTNISLRASDPESDPLSFHVLSLPKNGKITGKGGVLLYSPNPSFVGSDRFSFKANDGELPSNDGAVTIVVDPANHAPETTNQQVIVLKNAPSAIYLAVQDQDGDELHCPILKGPKHGRLSALGTNFTYVPNPEFLGSDSFTYKAWDGQTYSPAAKVSVDVAVSLPAQRITFESAAILPDGAMSLVLTQGKGQAEILVSPDLVNWTPLERVSLTGEARSVIDLDAPYHPMRFYLARPVEAE